MTLDPVAVVFHISKSHAPLKILRTLATCHHEDAVLSSPGIGGLRQQPDRLVHGVTGVFWASETRPLDRGTGRHEGACLNGPPADPLFS